MAEQSPSSDPLTTFGPNEWLVDELYEQYQKDKNSVDRAWWDFFKDYAPGEAALGRGAAAAATCARWSAAPCRAGVTTKAGKPCRRWPSGPRSRR